MQEELESLPLGTIVQERVKGSAQINRTHEGHGQYYQTC